MDSNEETTDIFGDDKIADSLSCVSSANSISHNDFGAQVSSPEASRQCVEAYQLFSGIYNQWNNNPALPHGETIFFDLLTPDQHLVRNSYKLFNEYVKSREGWSLKRREATPEERKLYRIRRKSKVYFIQAVYTVPLEGNTSTIASTISNSVQYYEEASFAKSNNSAFSPARRPLGGGSARRLCDSTNAAAKRTQQQKASRGSRVGEDPTTLSQPLDPNHSFVPLVRTPARKKGSPPLLRRPLPLAGSAMTSPLSPYMPPPQMTASASRISNPILMAAPQQIFPGGFVYGDIVRIDSQHHHQQDHLIAAGGTVSGQRGIVVGQAPSSADRLIVSTNMERLEVAVQELKLLKGMPRWTSNVASPPLPDGRCHLPK